MRANLRSMLGQQALMGMDSGYLLRIQMRENMQFKMFVFERINTTREFSIMDMVVANMLQFRASDKPMIIIIAIEMQIGGCGGVGGLLEKGVCCPSRFTNLFWRKEKGRETKNAPFFHRISSSLCS